MATGIGLFSCDDTNKTFVQMVEFCHEQGYTGLELYTNYDLRQPDLSVAAAAREKAEELGIRLCCMSVGADLMAANQKAQIERVKGYIRVAETAGAPYIHFTVFPTLRHDIRGVNRKQWLHRVIPAIRELCDFAGERGIMGLVEGQGYYANGLEPVAELVSEADHPNLGIVADLGNLLYADEPPEPFVGYFAPLVRHVHVKDLLIQNKPAGGGPPPALTRGGHRLCRAELGEGSVDIETCLRILHRVGYTGEYVIESTVFDRPEQAAADLTYMQNLLARVQNAE